MLVNLWGSLKGVFCEVPRTRLYALTDRLIESLDIFIPYLYYYSSLRPRVPFLGLCYVRSHEWFRNFHDHLTLCMLLREFLFCIKWVFMNYMFLMLLCNLVWWWHIWTWDDLMNMLGYAFDEVVYWLHNVVLSVLLDGEGSFSYDYVINDV